MGFASSKSSNVSIVKEKPTDHRLRINNITLQMMSELPIKSLGWWYNACLKDRDQSINFRVETIKGLLSIKKVLLPGKLKLCCLQFVLLHI